MSDKDGPRADGRPKQVAEARRVEGLTPTGGEFTYSVLPASPSSRTPNERRRGARQRTRLRSGKLIRTDGQFLCECLINNRSPAGCRLKLATAFDVPPSLYLYDDQSGLLFQGRVIWRKEREMGLRLMPCAPNALHRSIAVAMRQKFYALQR